jgi:hypothetical protein
MCVRASALCVIGRSYHLCHAGKVDGLQAMAAARKKRTRTRLQTLLRVRQNTQAKHSVH